MDIYAGLNHIKQLAVQIQKLFAGRQVRVNRGGKFLVFFVKQAGKGVEKRFLPLEIVVKCTF